MALQGYVHEELLTAAIDDETTSPWVDVRGRTAPKFYLSGLGTTSSGVITLEETMPRADNSWPATPVAITTVNALDVSAGVQKIYQATAGPYAFVRARVSTVIGGGGSVTVGVLAV